MDAKIVFAGVGINYITDSLSVKVNQNHRNSAIVGQDGSDISFVSSDARVISFKSICLKDERTDDGVNPRIQKYVELSRTYNKIDAKLIIDDTNAPDAEGQYYLTGFDYTEDTMGNFDIDWEFTQAVQFNVTQKTFNVWNKAQAKKNAKAKMAKQLSGGTNLNSNTKKLLKDCGTMKKGNTGNCVKCLQHFLQSQGYYTKYKVNGTYNDATTSAVKSLQKKHKLKATGAWDTETLFYFQVKYKYPINLTSLDKAVKQGKKIFK